MEAAAEKLRHGLLHEFIRDGLFRLVLIGCLRGEAVRHQNQAVLHVLERDLGLGLRILVLRFEIGVDRVDEGVADGLFRRAAVFEPRGIVVIFDAVHLIGEAERG